MVGSYDSGWGGRDTAHPVKEINDLRAQLAAAITERDNLKADLETERMRLAACGVGALQNTAKSAAHGRIGKGNLYWSASLGDVYNAVDREMLLRSKVEKLLALMLLTDPSVSSVVMSELQLVQHQAFLDTFPDERALLETTAQPKEGT